MARLAIISLGQLGGAVLERVARRGSFSEIIVASSNLERAKEKVNNVLIGSAIEGSFPDISVIQFDMHADNAAKVLKNMNPDVIFCAPSMMPWWRLDQLRSKGSTVLDDVPFATFLACQLAPSLSFQRAIEGSGLNSIWVHGSYPDVVNHLLYCHGRSPDIGCGNVLEAIPKIRFVYSDKYGIDPSQLHIRLVAQHSFEYFLYNRQLVEKVPPFLLEVKYKGKPLAQVAHSELFAPMPIPYALDFNQITASATIEVLEAFLCHRPYRTHAPSPNGKLGGYPVSINSRNISLDLPDEWTSTQAEEINRASLTFDGIEEIDSTGNVCFTDDTIKSIEKICGQRWEKLAVEEAPALADKLINGLSSF